MRRLLASAAVAALVAGAAGPSLAADMSGGIPGGMKGGAGAVPVPAPVPYNETYKYYLGGSLGWTFSSSGDATMSTPGAGVNPAWLNPTGPLPLPTIPSGTAPSLAGFADQEGPGVFSVFAGRYITPSLRMELGIDLRAAQGIGRSLQSYGAAFSEPTTAGPVGSNDINVYNVTRSDDVKVRTNTLMINAYYDFNRGGRITPYVGAGLGLSVMRVTRNSSEASVCSYGLNDNDLATHVACFGGGGSTMPPAALLTGSAAESQLGLAASLMAGASVAIGPRTHWDIGYRLMWQGSTASIGLPGLGGTNTIKVGDRLDHEIRTGLRFDVW